MNDEWKVMPVHAMKAQRRKPDRLLKQDHISTRFVCFGYFPLERPGK